MIAEFYACDRDLLDDPAELRREMLRTAERIGATVMGEAFHRFEPAGGVSGTLVIAESHLSIHTWPERGYAAVDLFTCGGLDPRGGFELLGRMLGAATGRMQEIVRGLPEEIERARAILPEDVMVLDRTTEIVTFAPGGDRSARRPLDKRPSRGFRFEGPDVRALREAYGLSQTKFAALMGISAGTLRNWEQGRRKPEGSARILLRVVERHPEAVLDVARDAPPNWLERTGAKSAPHGRVRVAAGRSTADR